MRILYYAFEYYCNYGARTHAQEFYHALKEHPLVNYAVVFPQNNSYDSISSTSKIEKTGVIKLLAKKIIPGHWISLYRMVWPKHAVYAQLKELIYREKIQYAIMRIGDQFQYIKYLKRDFPQLKVIVEMNATSFVEANRKVSFVENWKKYEASHLAVADAIITVSSYWKDYLIEYGVNENKIYVNPNGVNQSKFNDRMDRIAIRRNFGIPATSMVIGYVGGMETFRRLPEVIELLATFLNKNEKDFFIFIAGTGADILSLLSVITVSEKRILVDTFKKMTMVFRTAQ